MPRFAGHGHVLVYDLPDPVAAVPESEWPSRVERSGDACELDGERFFVRGRLEIPVDESNDPFECHLWVAVSAGAYIRLLDPQEGDRTVHHGRLANDLAPAFLRTLDVPITLHPVRDGKRPVVIVDTVAHDLGIEQRKGIPHARLGGIQVVMGMARCQH